MPIYEYKCQKCGSLIEALQKINAAPLKICSRCGGELIKQVSSPAIQFKGSGWYITDYAQKGANSSRSASSANAKNAVTEEKSKEQDTKKQKDKEKPEKNGAKKDTASTPAY